MCILAGHLEPSGEGKWGERLGRWKPSSLQEVGVVECAVPCFHTEHLLCFASGIPTQCYIICSQPFPNTTLVRVTLGQSWVKCNWNWMIWFLPEHARQKNKLKNREVRKRTQRSGLCLFYLYNFSCYLCFHICVSLVLLEAPWVVTSSH